MSSRVLCVSAALAFAFACGKPNPVTVNHGTELCGNGLDDNNDGKVDCADPTCFSDPSCAIRLERCDNEMDDNGNGLIDCADALCEGQSCGFECVCRNGVATDAPGGDAGSTGGGTGTDAGHSDAGGGTGNDAGHTGGGTGTTGGGTGTSGGGTGTTLENCANGVDDNGDGKIDCAESYCNGRSCGANSYCVGVECWVDMPDTGGGTGTSGGGVGTSGGGTGTSGGGTGTSGGGVGSLGGGTGTSGGGVGSLGGGTGTSGGGVGSLGGGTGTSGGGVGSLGGGTGTTGGGTAATGGGTGTSLADGQPCTSDSQCLGGKCWTEGATGTPQGMCTNATACTTGTNAGCNGGICIATASQLNGTMNQCFARCTGTGISGSGACRTGFQCFDPDTTTTNNNNYCVPSCTSASECAGAGSGYGCNAWSKRCGNTDQGKLKYGAKCVNGNSDCESDRCEPDPYGDGVEGWCGGICRGDTSNCASGGTCVFSASWGDNTGFCYQSCTSNGQCSSDWNTCWYPTTIGACNACTESGDSCSDDSECCSGDCDSFWGWCN